MYAELPEVGLELAVEGKLVVELQLCTPIIIW